MKEEDVCSECGKNLSGTLPFICKWCGNSFCVKHQLPENHYCTEFYAGKAPKIKKGRKRWFEFWKRWFLIIKFLISGNTEWK